MTTTEDIKFAKPQDITQIIGLGYKSFQENRLEGYGMSPSFPEVTKHITDICINHAALVSRNEEDDTLIDGVLTMQTTSIWWSEDPILAGGLFYIVPGKRSYKLAMSLLRAAKEYAIMNEMPLVLDLLADKDVQKKQKLFMRAGFKPLGSLYIFTP